MATKRLHPNPDLEQYRRQAKDLRRALAAREPRALERLRQFHPQGALGRTAKLADAQLVLAREHGFASWPAFAAEVGARQAGNWPVCVACDSGKLRVDVSGDDMSLTGPTTRPLLARGRSFHGIFERNVDERLWGALRSMATRAGYAWTALDGVRRECNAGNDAASDVAQLDRKRTPFGRPHRSSAA